MDPEVIKAIDAGVAGTFAPLRADCITGNCTWTADYSSLGWSAVCEDVTEEIVRTNRTFRDGLNNTKTEIISAIPGGIRINQSEADIPWITYAGMGSSPQNVSAPAESVSLDFLLAGTSYGAADPVTSLPWPECENGQNTEMWKCRNYGAARCHIFPSTKTYNSTVGVGLLQDSVTGADNAWGSEDGILIHSIDTHCIDGGQRKALEDLGYTITDEERWLAYNSTSENVNMGAALNDSFPDTLMKRGCQYVYWKPSTSSIQRYFASTYFRGTVKGLVAKAYGVDGSALKGTQAVQTIYNYGDVSFERVNDTIYNLTLALDNHVRQTGSKNFSEPALGQVNEEKTCIRIRWAWMAYPASLVVLTLVFFVLMAIETRPAGPRSSIWKSSPLALLYHGLLSQEETAPKGSTMEGRKEMEAAAKQTVVRLGSSPDGGKTGLEVQ